MNIHSPFCCLGCRLLLVVGMAFSLATSASGGLLLQSYSPKKHTRFYGGADKEFIGADFDSSGVGRVTSGNRWATMISEHYFVTASHWPTSNGQTVRFYHSDDPNSTFEDHVVAGGEIVHDHVDRQFIFSDLWLGRLETAPSADIARYPILDLGEESAYFDLELFVYGLDNSTAPNSQRLGRNTIDPGSFRDQSIDRSTGRIFTFDLDDPGGLGADEAMIQGGDSGGPSFAAVGNQLALVGTHWFTIGDNRSGDTFVPHYIEDLSLAMEAIGENLQRIPEPSSVMLMVMAGLAVGLHRRTY